MIWPTFLVALAIPNGRSPTGLESDFLLRLARLLVGRYRYYLSFTCLEDGRVLVSAQPIYGQATSLFLHVEQTGIAKTSSGCVVTVSDVVSRIRDRIARRNPGELDP